MAYSYVQYPNSGTVTVFPITFPYQDPTYVKVSVNQVPKTYLVDYTITGSTVVFYVAPSGFVDIRRKTKSDTRIVNFQDASTLTEMDLDSNSDQLFFLLQEALDTASGALPQTLDGNYDAQSKSIRNVATPVLPGDAAPKSYVDATLAPAQAAQLAATAAAVAAQGYAASLQAGLGLSKLIGFYLDSTNSLVMDDAQTLTGDMYIDWGFVPSTVTLSWTGNNLILNF